MILDEETRFRIIFGFLWFLFFVIRIYFQKAVKKKTSGRYVLFNNKQDRLLFRLFAAGYLLTSVYFLSPLIDFTAFPLSGGLRWIGCFIVLSGILFFSWSHHTLGANWTQILALSETHTLVTYGPYRHIRHPMYSAFFVIGIGFMILSANLLVGILYLGPLIIMCLFRIPKEEEMMLNRFGDSYCKYMKRTGKFFPRLNKRILE